MVAVEVLQPAVQDVGPVRGFHGLGVQFLLGRCGGEEAEFGDVVAEAVGRLGVLPDG